MWILGDALINAVGRVWKREVVCLLVSTCLLKEEGEEVVQRVEEVVEVVVRAVGFHQDVGAREHRAQDHEIVARLDVYHESR